jgi:vacuolar-type H+-ATPase subunit E/Vma4
MNTETLDLITNVVEELIAAIPQIVVVLTTVVYSLNAIKARVNSFPKIAEDTKKQVGDNLHQTEGKLTNILEKSGTKIQTMLSDANEVLQEKISGTLDSMEKELSTYKKQLISNIEQTNLLVKQNKVFMDVILELVAKDPKKVAEGVSQAVSSKVNLTKEQLEQYPQLLVKDLDVLKSAIAEVRKIVGEETFLEVINHGKGH